MAMLDCIRPELIWIDGELRRGLEIVIGPDGVIASSMRRLVRSRMTGSRCCPVRECTQSCIPACVGGRGEFFDHPDSNFWSWREAMYELVQRWTGTP